MSRNTPITIAYVILGSLLILCSLYSVGWIIHSFGREAFHHAPEILLFLVHLISGVVCGVICVTGSFRMIGALSLTMSAVVWVVEDLPVTIVPFQQYILCALSLAGAVALLFCCLPLSKGESDVEKALPEPEEAEVHAEAQAKAQAETQAEDQVKVQTQPQASHTPDDVPEEQSGKGGKKGKKGKGGKGDPSAPKTKDTQQTPNDHQSQKQEDLTEIDLESANK
jgi:hypothetical protein